MRNAAQKIDTGTQILEVAEELFSERGFSAVSLREIARHAGVVVSNVTYHHGDKMGILAAIYDRHTRPMNARRLELLGEARRIGDRSDRLTAVLRAYLLPAFNSSSDLSGGGTRFTRLRALLSAEGDPAAQRIIAEAFDDTNERFIDAMGECLPGADRADIVWRAHFLLGALYYTLINPGRIERLSGGRAVATDNETAMSKLVASTHASLLALSPIMAVAAE